MGSLLHDLRLTARALRKRPAFAAAAFVIVAVGIGANVTVFSIANAVLLRPMPFGDRSERVVTVHSTHRTRAEDWGDSRLSFPDLLDVRGASSLEAVGGYLSRAIALQADGETDRVAAGSVTPNLFPLLGVPPILGRSFTPEDAAEPGFESVVLLTHGLWQRRFGGDPFIVGRGVWINGRTLTVVGVMPRGFRFPERDDLYLPYGWSRSPRSQRSTTAVALLREGVTLGQAQSELDAIAARLAETSPDTNRGWGLRVLTFRDLMIGPAERGFTWTLLAAVGLVLVIVCANLANLLLVRGTSRRHEIGIRAAMGASRARLARELLLESFLLAVPGALLGFLLSAWALDAIVAAWPEELPYWVHINPDVRVVAFTAGVTILTALAVGALPAIRLSRSGVNDLLKLAGRGSPDDGGVRQRLQGALVVVQVAFCLGLLVSADLMIRSAMALQRADSGFDDTQITTFRTYLAGDAYDAVASRAAVFSRMIEALEATPGVRGAAATNSIPIDDGGYAIRLSDPAAASPEAELGASAIAITPRFFDVLGLRLLDGRGFTAAEALDPQADVAIVNETLARRLWPDGATERRLGLISDGRVESRRVIGVAPDIVFEEFGEATEQSRLNVYLPYARAGGRVMAVMIRADRDVRALSSAIRTTMRERFPQAPVYDLRSMAEIRAFTTWEQRFFGGTMGVFAVVALLLACAGVYGVVAYSVARRTRELGVRVALGAHPARLLGMVLWQGTRLGALGTIVGVPLAWVAWQALSSFLYGVDEHPVALLARLAVPLLAVVALATAIPAWRATRVAPAVALRAE